MIILNSFYTITYLIDVSPHHLYVFTIFGLLKAFSALYSVTQSAKFPRILSPQGTHFKFMGRFMHLALKRTHNRKRLTTLTSKLQSNDMLAKNATSNVSFCPVPCPLPSYPPLRAVLLTTDIFSNVGIDMTTTTIACV